MTMEKPYANGNSHDNHHPTQMHDADQQVKPGTVKPRLSASGPLGEVLESPNTARSTEMSFRNLAVSPAPEPASAEGTKAAATSEPSTDAPFANATHPEAEQPVTAAGDVRADDPIEEAATRADPPAHNGDVDMASPSMPSPVAQTGMFRGVQQRSAGDDEKGDGVSARTGNGASLSAPPLLPALDDGAEDEEGDYAMKESQPASTAPTTAAAEPAQSPTHALKRPPSPSPFEDETDPGSAKRMKLDSPAVPSHATRSSPPLALAQTSTETVAPVTAVPSAGAGAEADDMTLDRAPPAALPASEAPSASGSTGQATPAPPAEPSSAAVTPAPDASSVAPTPAPNSSSAGPVPTSAPAPPPSSPPREWFMPGSYGTSFSLKQQKYARNVVTQMRRHRCVGPFKQPVDPAASGVPHYHQIITQPMDFGTIEHRLGKVGKPSYYRSIAEFVADVQLIFSNCYKFNGPPSVAPISKMAEDLAVAFDTAMKRVPADEPPMPPPPPPRASPLPNPPKKPTPSSAPVSPKTEKHQGIAQWAGQVESAGGTGLQRPKREIKVPEKELPYFAEQAEKEAARPKNSHRRKESIAPAPQMVPNTKEEFKFCREVMRELLAKKHYKIAWPFTDPVDYVGLNIPDYPKIIKKPMDLGTIRKKLDAAEYRNGAAFAQDMRLIFNNCYTYNGVQSEVGQMGKQLESVFEMKWLQRPPERVPAQPVKEEADSDDEKQKKIKAQIAALQAEYDQNEAAKKAKRAVKPPKRLSPAAPTPVKPPKTNGGSAGPRQTKASAPAPSSSKAAVAPGKRAPKYREDDEDDFDFDYEDEEGGGAYADADDDYEVITYDQKKHLASAIQEAGDAMMGQAIELIRAMRPDLMGAADDEIELDIDAMDDRTLYKLYTLICGNPRAKAGRPKKSEAGRRLSSKAKGTMAGGDAGAGGAKKRGKGGRKKSAGPDQDAEQLAHLQDRLAYLEGQAQVQAPPPPPKMPEYASSSSDSESDSDDDSD